MGLKSIEFLEKNGKREAADFAVSGKTEDGLTALERAFGNVLGKEAGWQTGETWRGGAFANVSGVLEELETERVVVCIATKKNFSRLDTLPTPAVMASEGLEERYLPSELFKA